MEITWQGGGVPPHHIEMRTKRTRQGGRYPPYCAQIKRTRRVEMRATTQGGGGMLLLIALKWKEHDKEGVCAPSLSRQKGNLNTTGRAGTLPVVFKWQERNEEGHTPSRCVKKDRRTRQGGHQPSLLCWSSKNATRRGIPPPLCVKREVKTRRGGGVHSNNAMRRGMCPSLSRYGNDTGKGRSLPMRCGPIREISKLLLKENLWAHLYAGPLDLVPLLPHACSHRIVGVVGVLWLWDRCWWKTKKPKCLKFNLPHVTMKSHDSTHGLSHFNTWVLLCYMASALQYITFYISKKR